MNINELNPGCITHWSCSQGHKQVPGRQYTHAQHVTECPRELYREEDSKSSERIYLSGSAGFEEDRRP